MSDARSKSSESGAVRWGPVVFYWILAVSLSAPFRLGLVPAYNRLQLPFGLTPFKVLLEGSGPFIAGLVTPLIFRRRHRPLITLTGGQRIRSVVMAVVPLVVFTAFGVPNAAGETSHLGGLSLALIVFLYCLFEETGWRGYLQEALLPLPIWAWVLVSGCLWYLWHLSFLFNHATLKGEAFFLTMLVLGSWGIGMIALQTGSVAAAASYHMAVNVLFFDAMTRGIPMRIRLLECGLCLAIWIPLTVTWPKAIGGVLSESGRVRDQPLFSE